MQGSLLNLFFRLGFPILSTIFVISYYFSAKDLKAVASNYPKAIVFILLILLVWTFWVEVMGREKAKREGGGLQEKQSYHQLWKKCDKTVYTILAVFIYIILVSRLGMYTSTALFLLGLLYLLGLRRPLLMISIAAVMLLTSYLLFSSWLRVPLPTGILF